jgi:hypothetical protein
MEIDGVKNAVDDLISALSIIKDKLNQEISSTEIIPKYELDHPICSELDDVFIFDGVFHIWRIREDYIKEDRDCPICKNTGYVTVKDSFFNHCRRCTCQEFTAIYCPEEFDVIAIIKNGSESTLYGMNNVFYNYDLVKDFFNPEDGIYALYKSESECRRACDYLNGNKK